MASPLVDIGTGSTIGFGTSSFTAEITNIAIDGIVREALESSHMTTTAASTNEMGSKTFVAPDLSDPGSITIQGHYNPDTDAPVDGPAETVTITTASGATLVFSGFMTEYSAVVDLEEVMTFTAVVKVSGVIAITAPI